MTALQSLLDTFRSTAKTEREKGTYFERLVKAYLLNEPYYRDLYAGRVWLWEEWRGEAARRGAGNVGTDAGIDLVAETTTGEVHAIQAKFYDEEAQLTLRELSTFLTAAGRKTFSHGLIFLTATRSTGHLRDARRGHSPSQPRGARRALRPGAPGAHRARHPRDRRSSSSGRPRRARAGTEPPPRQPRRPARARAAASRR